MLMPSQLDCSTVLGMSLIAAAAAAAGQLISRYLSVIRNCDETSMRERNERAVL